MRVYTSVSELRDVPHVAGAGFKCGRCGAVKEFGGTGCGTGYGYWPGTLKIRCGVRTGRHNIAGKRYDVWFVGPDGKNWHGVTYGDNTQICRVRRLKK
jgi:hypothetical protein